MLQRALPALLLTACGAPDRWHVSSAYGQSEYTGFQNGTRDEEGGSIEVGVSGPLFRGKEPTPVVVYQPTPSALAPPAPEEDSIPWGEIALVLGGAAGLKGGEMGYRKVKARRSRAS